MAGLSAAVPETPEASSSPHRGWDWVPIAEPIKCSELGLGISVQATGGRARGGGPMVVRWDAGSGKL